MFTGIIRFCLANKTLTLLGTLALIAWGIWSYTRLPIDAIPDITNNQVQILTLCPTLTTQEVEQFVTMPIEQEVRNSPGILEMRSISRFGLSVITVVFQDDVPIYQARQIINERIQRAAEHIPTQFGQPEMAPVSTGLGEILHYRLDVLPGYEDRYTPMALRTIQDWIVKRQLSGIPGVVEINSFGGFLKQYEIAADPGLLRARDVSLGELYAAVAASNANTGGAYMEKQSDLYFIRTEGLAHRVEDIEQIVVTTRGGLPVLVRDVARVGIGHAHRYGAVSTQGGDEVVLGIVMMLKDENAAHVIDRVKQRLEQVRHTLPEGVVITPFLDRENLVNRTIRTVKTNLLEGALIVILILLLLVGNFRAALIIASVIPLCLLFALGMMVETGVTANLMSLGALDFGLVIDGAIILVEATLFYLYLRGKQEGQSVRITQSEMDERIILAASKVARSSVFGVLIIIIVYLPILSLTGIEGKMFRPMALTVSFALIGALILSLTYIPVISSLFLSKRIEPENKITRMVMGGITAAFRPFLNMAIRRPGWTVGLAIGAFLGASLLFNHLGGEFIPELDEGDVMMHGFCKPGTSLSQTLESHRLVQRLLLDSFPNEIDQVISKIGTAEIPTDPMAIETADNIILLHPKEQWTRTEDKEVLVEMMHDVVKEVPGMAFEFTQPIKMRFDEMMTGVRSDIAVKLFGDNLDSLAHYGEQLGRIAARVEGARDIKVEQVLGLPQLQITYDYGRMARQGITVQAANEAVHLAYAGSAAGRIYEDEKRFDLVVRMDAGRREELETMRQLPVRSVRGDLIPLQEIAQIDFVQGPAQISREDGQRRLVMSANVRGRDVESVIEDLELAIRRDLPLPAGYYLAYGGQFENLREARERLTVAVPVALFLISVLLFLTFGRLRDMALILSAIPLSAIGGVLALWVRGMPFSISAGVGFIALFGIAVLNGIVLISYLNELEQEGMTDILGRVRKATFLRLRPVMMTAATDAFGFLPMALSVSAGAEVQRPLATVVIGGLITSTLLTLVVLPALYLLVMRWREQRMLKRAIVPMLVVLAAGGLHAQGLRLTEQEALERMRGYHPALRADEASIRQEAALERYPLPWEPARIHHGINADPGDGPFGTTVLGVEMQFPSRAKMQASRRMQATRMQNATLRRERTEAYQSYLLRLLYLDFRDNRERLVVYGRLDSLYRDLERIAEVRYQAGETGPLEVQLIRNQGRMHQLERQRLLQEFQYFCMRLAWMIGEQEQVEPILEEEVYAPGGAILAVEQTLVSRIMAGQVREAEIQVDRQRALFRPEFGTDLYGQLVPDGTIYPGYTVSLRIPIFRRGYHAAVSGARMGVLRSQAEQESEVLQQRQERLDIERRIAGLTRQLAYYQEQGLPSAEETIRIARSAYAGGAADYAALILALEQAGEAQLAYREVRYAYGQAMLHYQLITQ